MYYDGVVYINLESELAPLTTFVHELTHGAESSKYYESLQNLVFSLQNDEDIRYGLDLIKDKYNENGIDLNEGSAIREYVAIQTQDLLGSEEFYVEKYAAVEAILDIFSKGEIIRVENNWKGREKDTVIIIAPIKIGNNDKFMSAIIEQYTGSNGLNMRYYLHELIILIKKKQQAKCTRPIFQGRKTLLLTPIIY